MSLLGAACAGAGQGHPARRGAWAAALDRMGLSSAPLRCNSSISRNGGLAIFRFKQASHDMVISLPRT